MPIVEPEVLMDGAHTIEDSATVTGRVLQAVYTELHDQRVDLAGTLLKPNMVLSGYESSQHSGPDVVAEQTLRCLYRHVPAAVPGDRVPVGRSIRRGRNDPPERDEREGPAPVAALVLVRARAAGAGAQGMARSGRERRRAQRALDHRAKMNGAASSGQYTPELEREAAAAG